MLTQSDRDFFRPKWRRVCATVLCVAWSVLEWVSSEPFWAMIATGMTFYCLWNFFYRFSESSDSETSNDLDEEK